MISKKDKDLLVKIRLKNDNLIARVDKSHEYTEYAYDYISLNRSSQEFWSLAKDLHTLISSSCDDDFILWVQFPAK